MNHLKELILVEFSKGLDNSNETLRYFLIVSVLDDFYKRVNPFSILIVVNGS